MSGFDELHRLEIDLTSAPAESLPNIKQAVGISLRKGKRAWQEKAAGSRRLPAYPSDISYETKETRGEISGELGPTPGDVGSLAIVEDAPGGVRGTPKRNYLAAEQAIETDLPIGIAKAVSDALREHGL